MCTEKHYNAYVALEPDHVICVMALPHRLSWGHLSRTDELVVMVVVQHTSASLTINENYDSDVLADTETFLNDIVPEVHFPV